MASIRIPVHIHKQPPDPEKLLDEGAEAALLAWLLWLPPDQDVAEAAGRELSRLALAMPSSAPAARLAALLREVASGRIHPPPRRSRMRH